MIQRLLSLAVHHPWVVLTLTLLTCASGVGSFLRQKIDAYPDISPQVVNVITAYPGRAPEEVERQVTIPLELAMGSAPRVEVIRSRTIFGLSTIELQFEEGVDPYWARQRVLERMLSIPLPPGAEPELGPLATAYGEVFRYQLVGEGGQSLMDLRTLNDWVVAPQLLRVSGVAEVSNFGGLAKQFAVTLDPAQLHRFGLTLNDIHDAIEANNANAGGSVMTRGSMSFVIRGRGSLRNVEDLGAIFVKSIGGTPVYLRDVATVGLDSKAPTGIFSKDAEDESVEGIVLMRKGGNPSEVLDRVKRSVAELNAEVLPRGVAIRGFYDRTVLVRGTLSTVAESVLVGITLVLLVLLIFLGSPAMALLVALTIPFSLLFALTLMYLVDIPIGLLSVGAIDFGIIVDGAVIMADHIAHRLSAATDREGPHWVRRTTVQSATEMVRPVFFSMLMIIGAYFPILTLRRIEGLLFRPMALTISFALIGALLFSLFAVPVLVTVFFRRGYVEWENPLLVLSRPLYRRLLERLLALRWLVLLLALSVIAFVFGAVLPRLGSEFLPQMDEGVIWVRANFPEGTSIQQNAIYAERVREIVREFADIDFVSVQSGRSDSGLDPFPASRMEVMVGPKPRHDWQQFREKQELLDALGGRLRREFPTTRFNFTQPIIDSVTEATNGTSANLAIEISGQNLDELRQVARQAVAVLQAVPGAIDVNVEQEGPQPQLVIEPDRALCARYNVRTEDVTDLINTALGGEPVGTLYEEDRRFDIVVRFAREYTNSPQAVGRLPVHTPAGVPIPLSQVAHIALLDGQTLIAREGSRRRVTVRCDIRGRDQGSFVREAQALFARQVTVPATCRTRWLGMFENLERAQGHFALLIPATMLMIYALLVITFGSHRAALIVLLSLPFALVGGAIALYLRKMHLNVSTGVGFTALFGVSIMNGVLVVQQINRLRQEGLELQPAIVEGSLKLLRPILMASLVAMLGLLPASLARGLGSDVQRPLATVIVWGLFSSTALTLLVLPVMYDILPPHLAPADADED